MVPKSSLFIRIVAGAYVIYLGEKLINSSLADKPENYILYIAAGVIFALIGLYWLVGSGIKMVKKEYRDDSIRGRMNESENETEEVKATENGILTHTYTFQEVTAPEGYALDRTEVELSIDFEIAGRNRRKRYARK